MLCIERQKPKKRRRRRRKKKKKEKKNKKLRNERNISVKYQLFSVSSLTVSQHYSFIFDIFLG